MNFDDFWKLYPRRVSKFTAMKAWEKMLKTYSAEEIIEGAKKYAKAVENEDKKFIKHPASWLNAGCWLDEDDGPAKPKFDSTGEFLARWNYHAQKQRNGGGI